MLKPLALCAAFLLAACGGHANPCPSVTQQTLNQCVSVCETGNAEVCARVGVAFESGAVGTTEAGVPDREAAVRYFADACEHASEDQRSLCVLQFTVESSAEAAARELERLCADGVVLACHELTRSFDVSGSIPIDLPGASTESESTPATILIAIAHDGTLYLDAEPTTLEAIRSMHEATGTRAVIAADRRTPHGEVVAVIDALRSAGVTRYAINVAAAEPP